MNYDMRVFLLLIMSIIWYELYWYISSGNILNRRLNIQAGSRYSFMMRKSTGVLFFGILTPVTALALLPGSLSRFGLSLPTVNRESGLTLLLSLMLVLVCIAASWISNKSKARSGRAFGRYPEITENIWNRRTILTHILFWTLYLSAYELLFRGILLFTLLTIVDSWIAVALVTVIYSAVHIPKGPGEAFGAIVLGVILSQITISTGSIIPAVMIHVALAIPNGLFAVHYRSDMRFA
jgi:membrane protease YdiL (CAAX protease family)